MAERNITSSWESAPGVPLVAPANVPTIRIRRLDTQALVVTDAAMTEVGDGLYQYDFTKPAEGVEYAARADGDPTVAGQVPAEIRFAYGHIDDFAKEVWQNEGCDPGNPKTITENTIGTDYSESVDQVQKSVVKSGVNTTLTRT